MSDTDPSGFDELRERVGNLERGLADNTAATKRIESDTSEMLEMFRAGKGGLKVLAALGGMVKWAVGIGVGITGIWLAVKGGMK